VIEQVRLVTSDGIGLEGEISTRAEHRPAAAMVLCHPHPQYGGTMRSIVISALFEAMPKRDVTCLRYNFRGVEGSEGFHDGGRGERLDAIAAIEELDRRVEPDVPMVLTGWSFGADIALSVREPRLAAWYAIASPLKFLDDVEPTGTDPRPKLVALAEHDEVRSPEDVTAEMAGWTNTRIAVVPGASHFFVGRTDRLVDLATDQVTSLARRE
jgi:alpha/beta superfamily hydrolase